MNLFQFLNRRLSEAGIANRANTRKLSHTPDYHHAPKYHGKLDETLGYLARYVGLSDDYMVRVVEVAGRSAAVVFIDTVTDRLIVDKLLESLHNHKYEKKKPSELSQYMIEKVVPMYDAIFMNNLFEIREAVCSGDAILLIDGVTPAIALGALSVKQRSPDQPPMEASTRGMQIGFIENLDVNVGLIRRAVRSDTLQVHKMKVGFRSRTEVAVLFLRDVANPVVVDTVLKRIQAIHVDMISQSAAIEQRIVDNHWTIFPLTRVTPRIDSTVRELNQGKVCIITDGDPTAVIVPATLKDFFQTAEDYAHTFWEGTFTRWLRGVAFVLALYLPSLYIAFVDFNPELLPKTLSMQIAQSREGVPFPAVVEVILMQVVVEILREATLRMPKQMGQTIGIVGGLVVGEASVQAGLVSNILIIVVSLTAISVFVTPSYEFATVLRLLSWLIIAASSVLGLYGLMLVTILLLYHMASLKSFGISFLDPVNGEHIADVFADGIVRLPVWAMDRRTSYLHTVDDTGETNYINPRTHPQLEKAQKSRRSKGRERS